MTNAATRQDAATTGVLVVDDNDQVELIEIIDRVAPSGEEGRA